MEREYQILTTELTDDELAAVSSGLALTLNETLVSGHAVAVGGSTGTGTGTAGWDLAKNKAV